MSDEPIVAGIEPSPTLELAPDVVARVEDVAAEFVQRLFSAPLGTPAFDRSIRAIDSLGQREIQATTIIVARFGDQPVRDVEAMLSERASLSRHLHALRDLAAEIVRRHGSDRRSADDLSRDVARLDDRIRDLVGALNADQAALEADNAALSQQERALWIEIETLRQYAFLAGRLDDLVSDRLETVAQTDPAAARALQLEGLYAIRRRRRDLLLQLAVATQGYAALRVIERDNLEIIWAIRAATSTTVSALRAAQLAVQAVSDRSHAAATAVSDSMALRDTIAQLVDAIDEVDRRRRTTIEDVQGRPRP